MPSHPGWPIGVVRHMTSLRRDLSARMARLATGAKSSKSSTNALYSDPSVAFSPSRP